VFGKNIDYWSSKCFSKVGREIMIKLVLHALSLYVMSIFQLSTSLTCTIERMMNSFWWCHGDSNNRGIHWMSWKKSLTHKTHGGMSFKDLSTFNLAMLDKQGWKFQTDPESIVSRIFKYRYFPTKSSLTANSGHNPSYSWQRIMRTYFIILGGSRWCIRSCNSFPILDEPWSLNDKCIYGNILGAHFVCDFIMDSLVDESSKSWNEELVRQVFNENIASVVPLVNQVPND